MRHTVLIQLFMAMLVLMPGAFAQESAPADEVSVVSSNDEVIVVCTIQGMIDPGILVVIKRAIKEATELEAKAIIFKVDTFGGRVDSAIDITTAIGKAPCQTIAFIEGRGAISAGAIISFACDDIIMAPDANIGASMVVHQTSEGMAPAEEKSVSLVRAKMRALAIANGYNPDLAEAMVDKDIELRGYTNESGEYIVYAVASDGTKTNTTTKSPEVGAIQEVIDTLTEDLPIDVTITKKDSDEEDASERVEESVSTETEVGTLVYKDGSELVLARGKLLTLTPSESIKYGLIEATAKDINEVVEHYKIGGGQYHMIEANWAEKTYRFLTSPTIAGLLMMLGIGGLYLEVRTPGFGVPGMVGIASLTLFFGSHYILGMAETIDILLVVVGVFLILLEIFVIPGFGLAGIGGMFCLIIGIYLSLVNFTIPQYTWEFESLTNVAKSFSVFVLTFTGLMFLSWRYMHLVPFYGVLVMEGTQEASEGYVGQDLEFAAASIGLRGTASTMLRPAGKGRFNGKTYDIVTRGDFVEKGTPVVIVEAEGNRYVVEVLEEEA